MSPSRGMSLACPVCRARPLIRRTELVRLILRDGTIKGCCGGTRPHSSVSDDDRDRTNRGLGRSRPLGRAMRMASPARMRPLRPLADVLLTSVRTRLPVAVAG